MPDGDSLDGLLQGAYRYALALCHDETAARDLVQDGCVAVLRAGGPFRRPYLYAAVRTRFADGRRRADLVLMEPFDELAPDHHPEAGLWADAEPVRADRSALERALTTVGPDAREALYLSAVEGYTVAEIASLTGRPRGTVLSLLFRAKRKLRAALSADGRGARAR